MKLIETVNLNFGLAPLLELDFTYPVTVALAKIHKEISIHADAYWKEARHQLAKNKGKVEGNDIHFPDSAKHQAYTKAMRELEEKEVEITLEKIDRHVFEQEMRIISPRISKKKLDCLEPLFA